MKQTKQSAHPLARVMPEGILAAMKGLTITTRQTAARDSAWADGLRGVAAVFVMASHMCLTLDRQFINPCCGPDERTPLLFQRPILRLAISAGQAWVSIFIILSGFVNSLKPITLARSGDTTGALQGIARSAFGRSFRLFLPAAAATLVSWFFEQTGLYSYARHGEAYWTRETVPPTIDSFPARIWDFFVAIRETWSFNAENHYDQPQWAMKYLLEGSMFVFVVLVMTIRLHSRWRIATVCVLSWVSQDWSQRLGDPLIGMNVFVGVILAELSIIMPTLNNSAGFRTAVALITVPLALFALVFMSMPMDNYGSTTWSATIMDFFQPVFPFYTEPPRQVISLGAQLLCLSVVLSPLIRQIFTLAPLLWLGKVSFAIYLLHGPLMRSVLSWCLYFGSTPLEIPSEVNAVPPVLLYPLPGGFRVTTSVIVFLAVLGGVAHLWTVRMEPVFGRMTKKAEDLMFAKENSMSPRSADSVSPGIKLKTDIV